MLKISAWMSMAKGINYPQIWILTRPNSVLRKVPMARAYILTVPSRKKPAF